MKKLWMICLLSGLVCMGCMPTIFVAGATAGGAMLYDQRDQKTIVNDVKLSVRAKKIFADAAEFNKQSDLYFNSYNRTLLITGQVSSVALHKRIDALSSQLSLAKTVYNQVRVTANKEKSSSTKDAWITTKVKAGLLAENGLHSNDFKVVTDNRIVYLMGLATPSKADLAARISSEVSGVTKVVKLIETTT